MSPKLARRGENRRHFALSATCRRHVGDITSLVEEREITDLLKAMMAPVRPYGSIFAYTGGTQKSIRGNYQFFEMDQNSKTGLGELYQLNKSGFGEHIYCVLCGRMTPDQKRIVRERSKVDTQSVSYTHLTLPTKA